MSIDNIKTLYTFSVNTEREVDETVTRTEGDKTITETIKVKKSVPTYFAIKKPSRSERENAEEERASWWSKYVEKGIYPEALLIRKYADGGGILSEDQRKRYIETKSQLLAKMEEYEILKITARDDKEAQAIVRHDLVDLRDRVIRFEQEQASFFENTAESKARLKLAEWLVVNLSYTRESDDKPWTPFFPGADHAARLASMEAKEEANDQLLALAQTQLYFVASFLISSNFSATQANIDEFLNEASAP